MGYTASLPRIRDILSGLLAQWVMGQARMKNYSNWNPSLCGIQLFICSLVDGDVNAWDSVGFLRDCYRSQNGISWSTNVPDEDFGQYLWICCGGIEVVCVCVVGFACVGSASLRACFCPSGGCPILQALFKRPTFTLDEWNLLMDFLCKTRSINKRNR